MDRPPLGVRFFYGPFAVQMVLVFMLTERWRMSAVQMVLIYMLTEQ